MPNKHPLRVQSPILRLLGDQLIGHDRLAVFELVKNSYDADASSVAITIDLNAVDPCVKVEDNGCGMSLSVITGAWLEVGTDSKRATQNRKRSELFNRLPLGDLNSTHKCNAHPCMHFVRRLPAQALARA